MNKPRKKEHLQIARFLSKNFLPYCRKHKYQFDINIEVLLKVIYDSYKKTQDDIAEQYACKIRKPGLKLKGEVSQSKISRTIGKINEKLRVFCEDFSIDPPIQMFHNYINPIDNKIKPFGFFLACSKVSKSQGNCAVKIVTLDKAYSDSEQMTSQPTNLKYLRDMKDVLKWDDEEVKAKWFRKSGPLATDFAKGSVYERKELLGKLGKLVFDNKISMLEGNAGSGKSVLIRQLAYNLIRKKNKSSICHYSFKIDIPISDFHEFKNIVNNIHGLIIIEDVHLATPNMQSITDELAKKSDSHILLTARSSFRDNMLNERPDTLKKIPGLLIGNLADKEGTDDTKEIIDHYIKKQGDSEFQWTQEIKNSIAEITKGNLWLLSYALKGCTGDGEPISWIEKGVRKDLKDLGNPDSYNCNPEILLALSPLYMNEVLTVQSFLIQKLSFERKEINKLVRLGEIIEHEIDGEVYYGLPHSSLAKAYWEHGKKYRKESWGKYEDFVYNYAISDVCNGLEAVIEIKNQMRKSILTKLDANNKIIGVIERERSLSPIDDWVSVEFKTAPRSTEQLLSCLVRKVTDVNISRETASLLESIYRRYGNKLLQFLDVKMLASKLNQEKFVSHIGECIAKIFEIDSEISKSLCGMLDFEQLGRKLNQDENALGVGSCISAVHEVNPRTGKKLSSMLDLEKLVCKLSQPKSSANIGWCISSISKVDLKIAKKLSNMFDLQRIAENLNQEGSLYSIGACLAKMCDVNSVVAKSLCNMLDIEALAREINQQESIFPLTCISGIHKADQKTGKKLCSMLDLERLVEMMNDRDILDIGFCVKIVNKTNPKIGRRLLGLLDSSIIVKKLMGISNADAINFLTLIEKIDKDIANKLQGFLQQE